MLAKIGVRVTELCVKDVILPGDMRELINKVGKLPGVTLAPVLSGSSNSPAPPQTPVSGRTSSTRAAAS